MDIDEEREAVMFTCGKYNWEGTVESGDGKVRYCKC